MTAAGAAGLSDDSLLLALCQSAAVIDEAADKLAAAVSDLPFSHPRSVAAFGTIDRMMRTWHATRLAVSCLPVRTVRGRRALAELVGMDPPAALAFSASRLPGKPGGGRRAQRRVMA